MIALYETEQRISDAAIEMFRGPGTAPMVPVSFMAGPDDYATPARLSPQMPAVAQLLNQIPVGRRWLNLGGWFGMYEFGSPNWGGTVYPQPHNPSPQKLTDACGYIADTLSQLGVTHLDGVFADNEGKAIKADGSPERYEQANRMAFLRKAMTPLIERFGCRCVNYACGRTRPNAQTYGWWGGPLGQGTIDGTSSVDCYSTDGKPYTNTAHKLANVKASLVVGDTIPHLPPLIYHRDSAITTPELAAQDLYDLILAFGLAGCSTVAVAVYMWDVPAAIKPPTNGMRSREHWPLLVATVERALAAVNRLKLVEVNAGA